ncbi:MAG: hypothetical protein IJS61_03865 [Firmicutes bacterium]|nr:hypothetical protein [Bacillota bacterium]
MIWYGALRTNRKTHIVNGQKIKARKKTNNKWFETQDSINYWDEFSKQKICWKRIGSKLRFSYDEGGCLGLDSTCFAVGEHIKYLVAILNSHIGNYLFKNSPKTGTGDLIVSVQAFEPVKVPTPSNLILEDINKYVDMIITGIYKDIQTYNIEMKLEKIISNLYGFTDDELNHIISVSSTLFR